MRTGHLLLVATTLIAACARDPLETPCPEVAVGGLVLSEIRGTQGGSSDTGGQWIEIYNASGHAVSLAGLSLTLDKIDRSASEHTFVRTAEQVAAAGYVTLGRFREGSEPAHVSYGFLPDIDANFYPAASVELVACGVTIDRAVYRTLPSSGTLGFDGARVPDATANDDERAWCVDADGAKLGTPLARNKTCVTP